MSLSRYAGRLLLVVAVVVLSCVRVLAQAGFDDDRVMLQGFYWESYRHGHPENPQFTPFGTKTWYSIVQQNAGAIRDGHFDLIWLPPPCYAGAYSAGYNPKEYFTLSNSYGSLDEQRAMLVALLHNGVEPVADLVLNHRDGHRQWADFQHPAWDTRTITRDDEAFLNPESEVFNTPVAQRGAPEETPAEYGTNNGTTYAYPSFRDIDHTNPTVRRDILKYMLALQSLGYRGWRYDMVHGYHARWIAVYNRATQPTFSVGEYDWDKHANQRGWIWYTATDPHRTGAEHVQTSSSVFDFTTFFTLKDNKGRYTAWYAYGSGLGMMGDTTDGLPWKQRAVTFLENHDTGYRTNEDGSPQQDHQFDSFANTWEVEQGYAYILTHPGVPCVYWKHVFDWGEPLRQKITALINARKIAGVTAGSRLNTQQNALAKGVYAAMIEGRQGQLYVRIGGSDEDWQPAMSNYHDYREYAAGAGWKVWVSLPGNPAVQQAAPRGALPVPTFHKPEDIDVPEALLN
jgi:alpha-amylase